MRGLQATLSSLPARAFMLLWLVFAAAGCPQESGTPVSTKCTQLNAQCLLPPNGPLGICNPTDCLPGQAPPCLKCVGQH